MNRSTRPRWRLAPAASRRGFSFTEVLFAVVILGIGFIMVAAIFPVALTQTKTTGEETNAASVSRGAINRLENQFVNASDPNGLFIIPTTAAVVPGLPPNPKTRAADDLRAMAALPASNPDYWAVGQSRSVPGIAFGFREAEKSSRQQAFALRDMFRRTGFIMGTPFPPARIDFLTEELWRTVKGDLILPSDTRYAWVPIFRRDVIVTRTGLGGNFNTDFKFSPASYAHVIVIAVEAGGGKSYSEAIDLRRGPTDNQAFPANLELKVVRVNLSNGPVGAADTVEFREVADAELVAEGSYLVVSDDPLAGPINGEALNGRVLRLGNRVSDGEKIWELAPGSDIPLAEPTMNMVRKKDPVSREVTALVVGKAYADAAIGTKGQPGTVYTGAVPDVGVYTGFIRVGN